MRSANPDRGRLNSADTVVLYAAVFILSFCALAFEVLLTRVFSINQWNHLSFMVISIALLGFAISGTGLNILDARKQGWEKTLSSAKGLSLLLVAFSLCTLTAFAALNRMPLDYFRLPVQPVQAVYLLTAYLLLSLPFIFTGTVVSTAYAARPEKTAAVYLATMGGSGCGALAPALLLGAVSETESILAAALLPLGLIPACIHGQPSGRHRGAVLWIAIALAAAAFSIRLSPLEWFEVRPSVYKSLQQTLQLPDTDHLGTRNGLRGRIDRVRSPHLRFAPGLSLQYRGEIPGSKAIFRDGDQRLVLYDPAEIRRDGFARFTLPYAGYLLVDRPRNVLLAVRSGGLAVACATSAGAGALDWVEPDPKTARILAEHYPVPLMVESLRQRLQRTASSYDVIHLEDWGTSIPGSAALDQNHWFTVDAFGQYLRRLTPEGVVIVSRKLLLPPSDSLRMWASAYQALQRAKFEFPEKHIVVMRSWDTYVLLVARRPIDNDPALIEFARQRNFDFVFRHGMPPEESNRFFVFDQPFHYREMTRMAAAYRNDRPETFFSAYLLDVAPQSDNRPFPDRMVKWPRVHDLYTSLGSRPYAMFLSGELVVVVVFFEALLISVGLLALPGLLLRRRARSPGAIRIVYFLSVGAGFIAVELYFIKQFVLVFGNAVVSFTLVLTAMLLFSGLGGFFSNRLRPRHLAPALLILPAVLLCQWWATPLLLRGILNLPFELQVLAACLWLAPAGLLAGLPFPLGMRYLVRTPAERTYAWSANGCTSVLTSVAAAQVALAFGIAAIMLLAAVTYGITLVCAASIHLRT